MHRAHNVQNSSLKTISKNKWRGEKEEEKRERAESCRGGSKKIKIKTTGSYMVDEYNAPTIGSTIPNHAV